MNYTTKQRRFVSRLFYIYRMKKKNLKSLKRDIKQSLFFV